MAKQERIRVAAHKGINIFYVEEGNKFVFSNEDGDEFEATSLKGAKQVIGKWFSKEDKEQKQPSQSALHLANKSYSQEKFVDVVTIGAFGKPKASWRTDLYFWVTSKGGSRSRQELRAHYPSYYKDTPEARAKLAKVVAIGKEMQEFEAKKKKEQEALMHNLPVIAPLIPKEQLPFWN